MKGENLYDHPWLVMTNDLRDWKVARGETVHDMKPVNPRFPEQGYTRTAKRQRPSWGGSVKTVSPTRQPAAEGARPRGREVLRLGAGLWRKARWHQGV